MPGKLSKSLKRLIHSGSYSLSKAAKKAGLEPEEPITEGLGTKTINSIEKAKAKAKSKPTLKRSKSAQLGGRRRRTRKHKSRKHRTRKY